MASPSLPYIGPVDKAIVNMNWINSIVETEAGNNAKDSVHIADIKGKHDAVTAMPAKQIIKQVSAGKTPLLTLVKKQTINSASSKSGKSVDKNKNIKEQSGKQAKPKYILPEKK